MHRHTQLPHKVPRNSFGDSSVAMNVAGEVPAIAILQNKENSIRSLKFKNKRNKKILIINGRRRRLSHKMDEESKQYETKTRRTERVWVWKENLNSLDKANNVGMINGSENFNLLEQIILHFEIQMLLVDFLNGHHLARLPMPGLPHHCEGTRPDSPAENILTDHRSLIAIWISHYSLGSINPSFPCSSTSSSAAKSTPTLITLSLSLSLCIIKGLFGKGL